MQEAQDEQVDRKLMEDTSRKKTTTRYRNARIILTIVAILLILLLLTACAFLGSYLGLFGSGKASDTGDVRWIRSIYSIGPNAGDQISPGRGAVGPRGAYYYITDQGNGRIIRLSPNFQVEEVLYGAKSDRPLPFYLPSGIAIAPDGDIVITRITYDDFWVMDSKGNFRFQMPYPSPSAVAVNAEMIVVGGLGGFAAYQRDGTPIGFIGFEDAVKDPDGFDHINGLWLDDANNVYVADTSNNRLSKYDVEGNRLWLVEIGPPGNIGIDSNIGQNLAALREKYPSMNQYPMQLTMDGAGRLMVIDYLDFSIAAFDPSDGSFIDKWGEFGEQDGQLYYPSGLGYDPAQDAFLITETGIGRAQLISIPESGGSAFNAAQRLIRGPLSMCVIPLFILIIGLILYTVIRNMRKRRLEQPSDEVESDEVVY